MGDGDAVLTACAHRCGVTSAARPRSVGSGIETSRVFCVEKEKAVGLPSRGQGARLWDVKKSHDYAHPWSSASHGGKDEAQKG